MDRRRHLEEQEEQEERDRSRRAYQSSGKTLATFGTTVVCALAAGAGFWIMRNYKAAPTHAFITKTGFGIPDIAVARKAVRWPFQQMQEFSMSPRNLRFDLHNMSSEKVGFRLPVVFTIAPRHPDHDLNAFKTYVTRIGNMSEEDISKLIEGVVNGETRILTAKLTIEEMFKERESFNDTVVNKIQPILDLYGLEIQNANIAEMSDMDGNRYFENLKQRALEEATTTARVSVAEARRRGDTGEKDKQVMTRKAVATMESDAVTTENTQKMHIAESKKNLELAETDFDRQTKLARIHAQQQTETSRIEMERELAKKKQEEQLETLRIREITAATAQAEALVRKSHAEAEAVRIAAEAKRFAAEQEAIGIKAVLDAKTEGLRRMAELEDTGLAKFYLALEGKMFEPQGLYGKIAEEQAKAISGMEPKITIWQTGSSGSGSNYTDVLQGLASGVPPLIDAVSKQTGLDLLSWAKSKEVAAKSKEVAVTKPDHLPNPVKKSS